MMEGINNQVNSRVNMPIGGNDETRGKPIWDLAKKFNKASKVLNGRVTCRNQKEHKGTYRPLPLV